MCAGRIWRTCCYIWRLDDDLCILQRISAYLTYIRFSVICTVNLYTPLARYCWLFELLVLHLIKCNCSVCRQFLSKCVHRFFKSYLMYIISYHVQLWCKTSRGNHLRQCNIQFIVQLCRSWDSSVGIATRYGLDCPRIESWWWRDFPHPSRPALGPPSPLYNGYRVFPGGKAAGAWRWPPAPI